MRSSSQSFNVVKTLRLQGAGCACSQFRNQSSVPPMAYKEFADAGRMRPSAYSEVMEELFKVTKLLRGRTDYLTDRYSERTQRQMKIISAQVAKILKRNTNSCQSIRGADCSRSP